jgi:surface antigen
MMPSLPLVRVSFKKEIWVVLITLGVVTSLPIVGLVSLSEVSSQKTSEVSLYTGPVSTVDTYDFGECTYWAALRREQSGHAIPNSWGNANTWAIRAAAAGYLVDHVPEVGAIMETTAGPYGHVAYVESVGMDGSWTISEMNFKGWDMVDSRSLASSYAGEYSFIH